MVAAFCQSTANSETRIMREKMAEELLKCNFEPNLILKLQISKEAIAKRLGLLNFGRLLATLNKQICR